jgi:hypothetical protein
MGETEKYIPSFTNITSWQALLRYNTGGSRSKYVALNPENNIEYFFKGSKETNDGEIRYPTEFWSEIVSSKVGKLLGFDILDYNIAYNSEHLQKVGCISKSMIIHSENTLTEGITYLIGFNPLYRPKLRDHQKKYTFEFISEALNYFDLSKYIENIIEHIIFDSIIGNSDRHQENWAVITKYEKLFDQIENPDNNKFFLRRIKNRFNKFILKNLKHQISDKVNIPKRLNLKFQVEIAPNIFAPIYDSGCCLGREVLENKISGLLVSDDAINNYIVKGKSEIHWNGKKQNHFELIKLISEKHGLFVKTKIRNIKSNYNADLLKDLIFMIDENLPPELSDFKLSDERKQLMNKLITLRIRKLFELL